MRVIGIDLGTRKVSLVCMHDGHLVSTRTWEADAYLPRQAQLRELALLVFKEVLVFKPDWVWLESIIVGNNRKYSIGLAEVSGAVQAQLSIHDMGMGTVDNKRWKKELIGNGNASKEMIRSWVDGSYPEYGAQCKNQDEYDAFCVALYGYQLIGRADGLKLD